MNAPHSFTYPSLDNNLMDDGAAELKAEVKAEIRSQVSRLIRGTEKVLVAEVPFEVTYVTDPGFPRSSYGAAIPPETELESVKLFGVELITSMSEEQKEQMMKALNGEEATFDR